MSVRYTKWASAFVYMRWTMKWGNAQWNDETVEGLSKGVKHTKWPSALAYDEMNIHVTKGE